MQNLHHAAINSALSHDWKKAILLNEDILDTENNNLDALSRLAYAYTKLGKTLKAKKLYKQILELDPYNLIVQKNLDRLKLMPKSKRDVVDYRNIPQISPRIFIEEPGKTKTINLTNLAPYNILSRIHIGDTVYLNPKKHTIEVRDENKNYIGALPDDISYRLNVYIKDGNIYHICVKNFQKKCVTIFLREIKRGKKMRSQPTFLPQKDLSSLSGKKPMKSNSSLDEDNQDEESEESEE